MSEEKGTTESLRKTAFFTGHRVLDTDKTRSIEKRVFQCITDAYYNGYRQFYCGCALGFDTIAAFQTIIFRKYHPDVKLLLAIPCASQADRWAENDRRIYHEILDAADDKTVLSPLYYRGAMLTRNRYMADRSSLCICYLQHMRGGTASTVRYALAQGRIRIINLAVPPDYSSDILREDTWNYTFISRSAAVNAVTAPLRLMPGKKLIMKNMSGSC